MKDLPSFVALRRTYSSKIALLKAVKIAELKKEDTPALLKQEIKTASSLELYILPIMYENGQYGLALAFQGSYYYFGGKKESADAIGVLQAVQAQAGAREIKTEIITCYFNNEDYVSAVITDLCAPIGEEEFSSKLGRIKTQAQSGAIEGATSELNVSAASSADLSFGLFAHAYTPMGSRKPVINIVRRMEALKKQKETHSPKKPLTTGRGSSTSVDSGFLPGSNRSSPNSSLLSQSPTQMNPLKFDNTEQCLKYCLAALALSIGQSSTAFEDLVSTIQSELETSEPKTAKAIRFLQGTLSIYADPIMLQILNTDKEQSVENLTDLFHMAIQTAVFTLQKLNESFIFLNSLNISITKKTIPELKKVITINNETLTELRKSLASDESSSALIEAVSGFEEVLAALSESVQAPLTEDTSAATAPADLVITAVYDSTTHNHEEITALTAETLKISSTANGAKFIIASYTISDTEAGLLVIYPNEKSPATVFYIGIQTEPRLSQAIKELYFKLFSKDLDLPEESKHFPRILSSDEAIELATTITGQFTTLDPNCLDYFLQGFMNTADSFNSTLNRTRTAAADRSLDYFTSPTKHAVLKSIDQKMQDTRRDSYKMARAVDEQVTELDANILLLTEEIDALRAKNTKQQQTIEDLRQELVAAQNITEEKPKATPIKSAIEVDHTAAEVDGLQKQVQEKQTLIEKLESAIKEFQETLAASEQEKIIKERENLEQIQALSQELETFRSANREQKDHIDELEEKIRQLESEIRTKEAKIEKLEQEARNPNTSAMMSITMGEGAASHRFSAFQSALNISIGTSFLESSRSFPSHQQRSRPEKGSLARTLFNEGGASKPPAYSQELEKFQRQEEIIRKTLGLIALLGELFYFVTSMANITYKKDTALTQVDQAITQLTPFTQLETLTRRIQILETYLKPEQEEALRKLREKSKQKPQSGGGLFGRSASPAPIVQLQPIETTQQGIDTLLTIRENLGNPFGLLETLENSNQIQQQVEAFCSIRQSMEQHVLMLRGSDNPLEPQLKDQENMAPNKEELEETISQEHETLTGHFVSIHRDSMEFFTAIIKELQSHTPYYVTGTHNTRHALAQFFVTHLVDQALKTMTKSTNTSTAKFAKKSQAEDAFAATENVDHSDAANSTAKSGSPERRQTMRHQLTQFNNAVNTHLHIDVDSINIPTPRLANTAANRVFELVNEKMLEALTEVYEKAIALTKDSKDVAENTLVVKLKEVDSFVKQLSKIKQFTEGSAQDAVTGIKTALADSIAQLLRKNNLYTTIIWAAHTLETSMMTELGCCGKTSIDQKNPDDIQLEFSRNRDLKETLDSTPAEKLNPMLFDLLHASLDVFIKGGPLLSTLYAGLNEIRAKLLEEKAGAAPARSCGMPK